MVKIVRKLVIMLIQRERGTFPRAIAVMMVPDDTVTGSTPIIQTPITNAYGRTGKAMSQASNGYRIREEQAAAARVSLVKSPSAVKMS